jgi:hypothetical protein
MKLSGSNSWLWAFLPSSLAFAPLSDQGLYSRRQLASSIAESRISLCASRRDVVEKLIQSSALGTAAALLMASPQEALASGGATAGGAYLLSAKQRYNERVKAGVQGFLALQPALEAGDNAAVRPYFTGEDTGTWKDITSAGYLLANAFRRSSNQAPDSLPSVKVRLLAEYATTWTTGWILWVSFVFFCQT